MFPLTKGMLLILFQWPLILTPNTQSFLVLQTIHIFSDAPFIFQPSLQSFSLFVLYASYLLVFSSDEKEMGDDEGTTQEVESETQSEEQQQQEEEEEEVEAEVEAEEVVQEEEEMETEQGHGAPVETEPQPS